MNGNNAHILMNISIGLGVLILVLVIIFSLRQQGAETAELGLEQFSRAVAERDPAICQGLDEETECMMAVEASSRDDQGMQGCYELESQEEFRICHDTFLIKQAEESKDPEICKQAIYSDYQEECEERAK